MLGWLMRRIGASASGAGNVAVGRDVSGSVVVPGSGNTINVQTGGPPPPPAPFTVPAAVGDFQGREEDLARLGAVLAADGNAVITAVHGMGGVGKTQLAYLLAHRLRPRFPDGCLHLDMQGIQAAALAAEDAMARVLQALDPAGRPPSDPAVLADAYRTALAGRRLLLLLDNARDTAQVRPLLPPAPVALLVTSRRRIVLPGAPPLELGPLPLPDATALLRRILGMAAPDEPTLDALAEACGRLPLALRAAGTFLLTYGWEPAAYLDALRRRRLTLLAQAGEDDPALDVRAVLGLSYDRLAEADAALAARFTQLAVFPAGFLPDAAAAVWDLPAEAAQAGLGGLLARSLIAREGGAGRYRLHDLLRDLAREQADPLVLNKAERRHSAYYASVVDSANCYYLSGREHLIQGLLLFDAERVNIEAGQAWAANHLFDSDEAARLTREYVKASQILFLRQTVQDRITWREAALTACRKDNDRKAESEKLGDLDLALIDLGEIHKAINHFEHQLIIAQEISHLQGEIDACGNLGSAWRQLGRVAEADAYLSRCVRLARQHYDRRSEGRALGHIAALHAERGEFRTAVDLYSQQLGIAQAIGNRYGESNAFAGLGAAWTALGDAQTAVSCFEKSLIIALEIGDRRGTSNVSWQLSIALDLAGLREPAIVRATEALRLKREIKDSSCATVEAWLRARGVEP